MIWGYFIDVCLYNEGPERHLSLCWIAFQKILFLMQILFLHRFAYCNKVIADTESTITTMDPMSLEL